MKLLEYLKNIETTPPEELQAFGKELMAGQYTPEEGEIEACLTMLEQLSPDADFQPAPPHTDG